MNLVLMYLVVSQKEVNKTSHKKKIDISQILGRNELGTEIMKNDI